MQNLITDKESSELYKKFSEKLFPKVSLKDSRFKRRLFCFENEI